MAAPSPGGRDPLENGVPRSSAALASSLDSRLSAPVVVFGSVPPEATDLDLLAGPDAHEQVCRVLDADGFRRDGRAWARFCGCGAEAVDLVPSDGFGLPQPEVERLFDRSVPLEGHTHLRRPSAADTLLILARQAAGRAHMTPSRRERARQAARWSGAWDEATRRAPAWGASLALAHLRHHLDGASVPRRARARAVAEVRSTHHMSRPRALLGAWRAVLDRDRGHVIAISGLDGAGKTTQADALVATLQVLDRDAVRVRTRLGDDPALDRAAWPVKRLLARLTGRRWATQVPATRPSTNSGAEPVRHPTAPQETVLQGVVREAWALLVTLTSATAHRRHTRPHLRAGRIVLCDRYVLDSTVHLRYRYGPSRNRRLHVALLRLLSPTPVHAVFLDVPGETAWRRRQDHYTEDQLRLQASLYREEHRRASADRVDGTAPVEQICAHVAEASWRALRQAGRRRQLPRLMRARDTGPPAT